MSTAERIRVLFIEDDRRLRDKYARLLRSRGLLVTTAPSGETGMEKFDPARIDVVLTDLNMPRADGLEVLAAVKQASPDTPVLILTSHGDAGTARDAIRLGAYHFILKPVEINDLYITIFQALEHARLTRELNNHSRRLEARVKERTEKLEYANRQLRALNDVSNRFAQMFDEQALLDQVPDLMTESLDFDRGMLFLEKDGELSLRSVCFRKDPPEMVENFRRNIADPSIPWPPHIREVLATNRTIFIPDLNADPRWPREPGRVIRTKALVMTPIRHAGEPIGLIVGNMQHHDRAMDEQDIARVEMFAGLVSAALDKIRAYQSLEQMVEQRTANVREKQRAVEQKNEELRAMLTELNRHGDVLQSLIDTSFSAIIMADNSGTIVTTNRAVPDYFGIDPAELLGLPIEHLHHRAASRFEDAGAYRALVDHLRTEPDELDEALFSPEMMFARALHINEPADRLVSVASVDVVARDGDHLGRVWMYSDITEHMRADQQLRTIIDASPIPTIVSSIDDGTIIYANDHLGHLVGLSAAELIGQRSPDFYRNREDREKVVARLMQHGQLHNHEVELVRANGTPFWAMFSLVKTTLEGRPVIIGGVYDISKRKRAEEALQAERNFIAAVLETAGALIVVLDPDGRIVRFNRAAETISGYKTDDVIGETLLDFLIPKEQADYITEIYRKILTEPGPVSGENDWITADGGRRRIEWSNTAIRGDDGAIEYIVATGIDITDRKAAEQNLRLYREIFKRSIDPMAIFDLDGFLVDRNPAHAEATKYVEDPNRVEALLGETWAELVAARVRAEGRFRGEITRTLPDGSVKSIDLSAFGILDEQGELLYFAGIGRDITELRKLLTDLEEANREIRDTQSQLVQSEKMASLGMLVAGIAHEINTPIGAVGSMHNTLVRAVEKLKTALESALTESVPDETRIKAILQVIDDANRVIANGTDRVTTIVKRLRSFARLDEAELKRADIHEGIEDTLTLIHHEIKHSITIARDYADLPTIACFPGRLNQVFLNLLNNARQAIDGQGTITITTRLEDNRVVISISDTGHGIKTENLAKVFDPGFTTKGVGVGTGLGLSICYQIVRDHLGDIQVESEPGKGTTFHIKIPTDLDKKLDKRSE